MGTNPCRGLNPQKKKKNLGEKRKEPKNGNHKEKKKKRTGTLIVIRKENECEPIRWELKKE